MSLPRSATLPPHPAHPAFPVRHANFTCIVVPARPIHHVAKTRTRAASIGAGGEGAARGRAGNLHAGPCGREDLFSGDTTMRWRRIGGAAALLLAAVVGCKQQVF